MKLFLIPILCLLVLNPCSTIFSEPEKTVTNVNFNKKDKEILKQLFQNVKLNQAATTGEILVKTAKYFLETPYLAHTLETEPETLTINLREFDCTTFAESCLAISKCIKNEKTNFESFCSELKNIRYYKGNVFDYTSRIHYFSHWIYENDKQERVKSLSEEIGKTKYEKSIYFMSSHPESYKQLKNNSGFVSKIQQIEEEINNHEMYFIPENKIKEVENQLKEGDIVGITTSINGLDIMHVGILVRKNNRMHLLHASSDANKVIISEETLENYLRNSKPATGIMLARPR